MTTSWSSVAKAIRVRREEMGLSRPGLALRAGGAPGIVSESTIKNLEGARDYDKPTAHALLVERALGWTPGSLEAILAGGEPTLLPEAGTEPAGGPRRPPYTIDRESGVVIYKWDEHGNPTALFILVDEGRAIPEEEVEEIVDYMLLRKRRRDARLNRERQESQQDDNHMGE